MTARKITPEVARDAYPGAVETWIILALELYPFEFASEADVLKVSHFYDNGDTLRVKWRDPTPLLSTLTEWDSKKLEWADTPLDIDTVVCVTRR